MTEARIVIGADSQQAISELARLKAAFSNDMNAMQGSAALATKAIGLLGLGAVALSFTRSIKEAIDLADSLNKLSQRTGVTTESLSQLQYAAKLADVSSESLTTGLKKLNVSIANGIAGDKEKVAIFKALGITLTDTAGKTKSADQVLLDLADTFSKSKDGAGKTAAAVALLGKAGDEMIPLLNGGSAAIIAMQQEADKLGLTIGTDFAKKSEEFNDNLTRLQISSQKLAIAFASDLVDGLGKAMKAMADAAIEGGKLQGIIAGIQMLLTGDDRHKNNVALVEDTEKLLQAEKMLAAARSAGRGSADIQARQKWVDELNGRLKTTLTYRKMLDDADDKSAAAAKKIEEARKKASEVKTPDASGGAPKKIDPQIKAYADLTASIREKIAANLQEIETGRKLTDSEKQILDIQKMVEKGTISAKNASSAKTLALLAELTTTEKASKAEAVRLKYIEEGDAARLKGLLAGDETLKQMADQNGALRDEIELIGLNEREQLALNQTRNDAIIGRKQERLAMMEKLDIGHAEQEQLKEEIRLLKERQNLQGQRVDKNIAVEQAKEADSAWKSFYGDLERGLTDSLFRAFESGKGFFRTLWDGIKNLFKTTVLKLGINGVVGSVLGGMAGGASADGGAGGLMGLANGASSLNTLYGAVTGTGTISAMAGAFKAGAAIGTEAFGAGVAMMTNATGVSSFMAGGAQALGAMGPAGWIALAALAAFAIFKKDKGPGSANTGNATASFDNTGSMSAYQTNFGGSSKAVDDTLKSMNAAYTASAISLGIKRVDTQFATGGYSTPGKDDAHFRTFARGGSSTFDSGEVKSTPEAMQLAVSRAVLAALKGSDLPRYLTGIFSGVEVAGASQEQITKLLEHAAALKTLDANLQLMPMESLKNLSYEAAQALITYSGGIEALTANLGSFYDNFYSAEEKRAQSVKNITATLNAAGGDYSIADVGSAGRENFRKEVERVVATLGADSPLHAALLNVNNAFAGITTEAKSAGVALDGLRDVTAIAATRAGMDITWMELTGDALGAVRARREAELAVLDDSLDVFQTEIWARQDLNAANEKAAALASVHKGLSDQLAILKGTETERSIALRDATDHTTKSLLEQIHAQQDLNAATEQTNAALASTRTAAASVNAALRTIGTAVEGFADAARSAMAGVGNARKSISDALFAADDAQTAAQERINDIVRGRMKTIDDFLNELSGTNSTEGLSSLKARLSATSVLAAGGDSKAQGNLIQQAQAVIKAAEAGSTSRADFARSEAFVRSQLLMVRGAGAQFLDKAPGGKTEPLGDFEAARADLNKASSDVKHLLELAVATGSNTNKSLQDAAGSITSLAATYNGAVKTSTLAQSDYSAVLLATQGLQLTTGDKFSGLNTSLADLSAANIDLFNSMTLAVAASDVLDEQIAGMFGLTGTAATTLAGLLGEPGTAATTLATLLGAPGTSATALATTLGLTGTAAAGFVGAIGLGATNVASVFSTLVGNLQSVSSAISGLSFTAPPPVMVPITTATGMSAAGIVALANSVSWDGAGDKMIYDIVTAAGGTSAQVDAALGLAAGTANAKALALGLPPFAEGSNYVPYDMNARIHQGEEIKPARFVDMDRSARDQTNALLARLIDSNAELRKEVAGLRKAGEATAKNTEESSKTLNVVTRGGRAIQTEAFT